MLFVILLLISAGLSCVLLLNSLTLQIIAMAICILGVCALMVFYKQLLIKARSKIDSQKQQLGQLTTQLEKKANEMEGLLEQKEAEIEQLKQMQNQQLKPFPSLPAEKSLDLRLEDVRSFLQENFGPESKEQRRFFSELKRAVKNQTTRENIKEGFTNPLLEKLKDKAMLPLEEDSKQELLANLMQLAFAAIDYTQDFHSDSEGKDSLALRLATKAITEKEAINNAETASSNVNTTEKEYRVLLALVSALGIADKNLIVHDILLKEKD